MNESDNKSESEPPAELEFKIENVTKRVQIQFENFDEEEQSVEENDFEDESKIFMENERLFYPHDRL